MKKIKCLLLVMLVFFTINVKAADSCDTKELNRLKELAKKIEFDYDYKVVDDVADFTINAHNLNEDLKVMIIENYYADKYREFKGTTDGSLSGFKSGERVVITIKGFVPNGCSGKTVLTKTIKLPYYNIYYVKYKPRCEANADFKYCKYLLDSNITEEEFEREFNRYYNKNIRDYIEKKDSINEEQNNSSSHTYIIIAVVILLLVMVVVVIKKIIKVRKKNKI